jgi:hypothetical protein
MGNQRKHIGKSMENEEEYAQRKTNGKLIENQYEFLSD